MKAALIHEADGLRTFAIILQSGDEAMRALADYAGEQRLQGSHFTAIGAFSDAVVAYFDWQSKQYRHIDIAEQVEVVSMIGDIALDGDAAKVHAHVVLAKPDASAHGGHLIAAHVRPTLEIVLTENPRHLRRRLDPESGLALIDPRLR